MGLFSRNRGDAEKRARDYGHSHNWATGEDVGLTDYDARGVGSMRLSIVYGCVARIANRISAMPLEMEDGKPRPLWLDMPDPFGERGWGLKMKDVVNQIVTSMLIDGNAFIALGKGDGLIQELQVLNPRCIQLTRRAGEISLLVEGLPPHYDVLVVRNIVLPGEIRGLSPVEACQRLIEVGVGSQELASRFHEQGLTIPGVISTTSEVTGDQVNQLRQQLQSRHGGSKKSHFPLVLGQAQWQSIGFDSQQAQFLESRHFSDAQIAAHIFHLDPSLMGNPAAGSSDVYQNVELRSYEMLVNALLPIMERIEEAFNSLLPFEHKVAFDYDTQLRGDIATRFRTYESSAKISKLLGKPLMTVNEMREREGLEPIEGGDEMGQPQIMMMPGMNNGAGGDDDVDMDDKMPEMSKNGKAPNGMRIK